MTEAEAVLKLEQLEKTISFLEKLDESTTEPFRIVIVTLKQKAVVIKKNLISNH